MKENLSVESRIEISENYHWAKNAVGVVTQPPDYIVEMSDGWRGNIREVESLRGILSFYWVKFDEPQLDADGDGPYHEAEIDSDYLNLLDEQE
ncbi:MAG: hypothetical protein ACR2HT_01460 [Pyrinomonadaceae bacterium]